MPRARTTDDLLSEVRARVAAPSANGLLSSTELLELATQELRTEIAHLLISIRSEYWLANYTASITSGVSSYRLPDRALGMGLRDVTIVDSNSREWNAVQIPADQRYLWTRGQNWAPSGPFAFTLDNGSCVLLPAPTSAASGYTLRLRYYVQPSRLVAVSETAAITRATSDTTLALEGTIPSWVSNISDFDVYVDVVRGGGMFDLLLMDGLASSYSDPTLTLDATTPIDSAEVADARYAYGRRDVFCKAGETSYVQVPDSVWPLLVALTCRAYCEAIGDMRGMEAAAAMYERKRKAALGILEPRVDGEVMRPVPIHTPLRRGRRFGGWQ